MKNKIRNFRVITNDSIGNEYLWDIYTVDGHSPDNTQYFFKSGDLPSYDAQNKIAEKIESGDYLEII